VQAEKNSILRMQKLDTPKQVEKHWVTLEDSQLIAIILKSVGDEDKKSIINAVIDKPHTISEILDISITPKTSGYRKINALISDGILIPQGYDTTHDGKRVTKYKAIFDNISILIEKNKVVVKIHTEQMI
jgi:predicted transcriptional regulator